MLDMKLLRTELPEVIRALRNRGASTEDLDGFTELDLKRREWLQESEQLRNRRNTVSQEIARKKKAGESADDLVGEMRDVGDRIKLLDEQLRNVETELQDKLLRIPNIPHASVPVGASEDDNEEIRRWGEPPAFDFEPHAHWELAGELDILDFERAAKVTGSRFVFYKGAGARLERALIQWMMDVHADEHGYVEMLPPYIVNRDSMIGTGLPLRPQDVAS